jgi:hypothetical protein
MKLTLRFIKQAAAFLVVCLVLALIWTFDRKILEVLDDL